MGDTRSKTKLATQRLAVFTCLMTSLIACAPVGLTNTEREVPVEDLAQVYTPTLPHDDPRRGEAYQTILEAFSISNIDGEQIHGLIRRPDPTMYPRLSFAAVIKVPGGINPGRSEALTPEAIALAEAGMVVVTFNAEGRSDPRNPEDIGSEGAEDFNGFRNQDTLAEIFRYTMQLPYVINDNVGIRTQSYGITMGAGCAARHPDLPIKYIVDGEGPPSSFVTAQEPWVLFSPPDHPNHGKYQTVHEVLGHYATRRDTSAENRAFWSEREAILFIGQFGGMYLRLQGEWDHAQPPSQPDEIEMFHHPPIWWQGKHACDMVNGALDGGVPWVRVNLPEQGNAVNERCVVNHMPNFLEGELNSDPMIPARAVLELARSEPVRR